MVAFISSPQGIRAETVALFGGALFYCMPHLCWAVFPFLAKPGASVIHADYVGATLATLLIASLWLLLPQDPSWLPIQWMAYWPLAGILAVTFSGAAYLVSRLRNS